MKHHIIVKYTDAVADKAALLERIKALYAGAAQIPGVHGVEFKENCVARENRYDLMIVLDMDADALAAWDASAVHHAWKDEYGHLVAKKAIFDCE